MSALPWLIGGVCAGLLGVCVLALLLFGLNDREQVADGGQIKPPAATGGDGDSNTQRRDRDRRLRIDRENLTPATGAPDRLSWDREPDIGTRDDLLAADGLNNPATNGSTSGSTTAGETGSESSSGGTATTKPAPMTLASLPRAFALPRPAADAPRGPAVLTRVEVNNPRDVKLQLISNAPAGGSGRFELLPLAEVSSDSDDTKQTWEVQHTANGGQPKSVGQYTLADGELSFAWSPESDPAEFSQLENHPLQISSGEESTKISQRVADEVAPITIKVDAGAIGETVSVANPPKNASIVVAVEELGEEFGNYSWEPEGPIPVGKSSMLRFGGDADAFQFALEVSADDVGGGRVRIESRPMFRVLPTKKWDYFRPTQTAQTLASLQQQQPLLDAQLAQIQQRYRRDRVARDQALALHNQQSSTLLENIANLERISDRCQELQDKAQLHFRIYAENGEDQIDLVRTVAGENSPAQEPAPADENIGPPIEPAE